MRKKLAWIAPLLVLAVITWGCFQADSVKTDHQKGLTGVSLGMHGGGGGGCDSSMHGGGGCDSCGGGGCDSTMHGGGGCDSTHHGTGGKGMMDHGHMGGGGF